MRLIGGEITAMVDTETVPIPTAKVGLIPFGRQARL